MAMRGINVPQVAESRSEKTVGVGEVGTLTMEVYDLLNGELLSISKLGEVCCHRGMV